MPINETPPRDAKDAGIPVQLVFQGGGAKLCDLMAVCSVIEEYQKTNRINVTRVAGASAGAIAAVMLASEYNIETYKARIKNTGALNAKKMDFLKWLAVWRVANGGYVFHKLSLEAVFEHLFEKKLANLKISKLTPALELYYTDLHTLESRSAPADDTVSQALTKSCRFPFAFTGYKSNTTEVDGGLSLNLPVDQLHAGAAKYGSVIGISFESRHGNPKDKSLKGYVEQLFSAAIQSSVTRSASMLGEDNVHLIDTDVGTFDFGHALEYGLDRGFKATATSFRIWMDKWLEKQSVRYKATLSANEIDSLLPRLEVKPQLHQKFKVPQPIIRELWQQDMASAPKIRGHSAEIYETANFDNGRFNDTYTSRSIFKFEVLAPVNIQTLQFEISKDMDFDSLGLKCWAADDKGAAIKFTPHVEEVKTDSDTAKTFRLYFLFETTLLPKSGAQPFWFGHEAIMGSPYPNLGKKSQSACFFLGSQAVDSMSFARAFPMSSFGGRVPIVKDICEANSRQLEEADFFLGQDETLIQSSEIHVNELLHPLRLELSRENYLLVGRRAQNVRPKQGFGVIVE